MTYSKALHTIDRLTDGPFYKLFRFKTGEIILCMTEENIQSIATETYIEMIDPCVRHTTGMKDNEYSLVKWIAGTDNKEFIIPVEMVLTIGDMDDIQRTEYKIFWSIYNKKQEINRHLVDQDIIDTEIMRLLIETSVKGNVAIFQDEDYVDDSLLMELPMVKPPNTEELDGERQ